MGTTSIAVFYDDISQSFLFYFRDEDCLVLGYTTNFYWVDYPCSYPTYYICEAEMSGQK